MNERHDLGHPGPYLVCAVCNRPLDRWTDDEGRSYALHLDEADHDPEPKIGTPLEADQVCDFCHAPKPEWVFVPRKQIRIERFDVVHDYSSPWSACGECAHVITNRDLSKLVTRAVQSPHGMAHDKPRMFKQLVRRDLRELYGKFWDSDPAGPFEVRM